MRRPQHFARITLLVVALGAVAEGSSERSARAEATPAFVVIVHSQSAYTTLDRTFVSDAFLKKTTRWPDGEVIKAIDLPPDSPVRAQFSQQVLKRSVASVKSYWQQIIFSGRDVPPPELPNEEEAIRYVTTHTHAIGYVSGGARLGDARVVTLR